MKKAILLLSLGCLLGWASAAPVDTATAKSIAATFWNQSGLSFRNSVAADEWEMLRSGTWLDTKSENAVQPLITATWGQGAPYNAMCPTNTLVGCVAVAMGEVMRYWQYPAHGTGSHSYTYGGQSHSVDFSAATYNYAAMPNSCSSTSTGGREAATTAITNSTR